VAHATSHENGGTDEINVGGLSGVLADPQTPATHTHATADVTSGRFAQARMPDAASGFLKAQGAGVDPAYAALAAGDLPTHDIITKHTGFPGGGTTFLRDDGTFAAPPAGGSPPTGTGFRHVTAGVEDAASKLVDTADINNDQVTPAKLDNGSGFSVLGKATTGSGDRADIVAGDETVLGRTGAGNLSFAQVVTGQIATAAVTLAKIANIATARILGRITAASGVIEELTGTQATTLLDVFTSGLKGLVPASGGGTTNFLRADGTFAAPPGGSGASLTRINGSSGAAGADLTWQKLSANSSDITSTTPAAVMTTTGVGAGTWHFRYVVIYQSAATTTGIGLAVNHTGTSGQFASHLKQANSTSSASNGAGEDLVSAQAGQVYEARPEVAKDTVTFKTVGVGNANTDVMAVLEGIIVVTVNGSLELKLSTEVDTSAVRLMADSLLELNKIG
jgi:hypothetical protein